MGNEKLRHGEAMSIQWLAFTLDRIMKDIKNGSPITKQLLAGAKSTGGGDGIDSLYLGCEITLNFLLPFSIELALKAMLTNLDIIHPRTHDIYTLYKKLPHNIQENLKKDFVKSKEVTRITFDNLIKEHRNDFVEWRYLDNPSIINGCNEELQFALCTILDIYNS